MKIDISAFSFEPDRLNLDERSDFIAHIPDGLTSKPALLAALSEGLNFPVYFGKNWDALSDCLRDLSWLSQPRIVILHADMPGLPIPELMIYLDILASCMRDWKAGGDRELVVVFPRSARGMIGNLPKRDKVSV